jgi:aminoglycoside phosphotransferase
VIASRPTGPVAVPDIVARRARGRACDVVWGNELGGLTFRLGDGADLEYMKWHPDCRGVDLQEEARRLAWACDFTAVPRVLDVGEDEGGQWLVTEPLAGENAVSDRWKSSPERAAAVIGRGLRNLHESLPVGSCPFSWTVATRLSNLRRRRTEAHEPSDRSAAGPGTVTPEQWVHLESAPTEDLVVCHGDACAPNTLIDDHGACSGHVDVGRLGVGDRWADIAVAAWSTEWNYGPGYEDVVYDSYGVDRDDEKILYYRLLWEMD